MSSTTSARAISVLEQPRTTSPVVPRPSDLPYTAPAAVPRVETYRKAGKIP